MAIPLGPNYDIYLIAHYEVLFLAPICLEIKKNNSIFAKSYYNKTFLFLFEVSMARKDSLEVILHKIYILKYERDVQEVTLIRIGTVARKDETSDSTTRYRALGTSECLD